MCKPSPPDWQAQRRCKDGCPSIHAVAASASTPRVAPMEGDPPKTVVPPAAQRWVPPAPLGEADAVQILSGVAAPLLAGFSFTLIGIIVPTPFDHLRWPNLTLALLVGAAVTLIIAVQVGARARAYQTDPDTVGMWLYFFNLTDRVRQQQWHAARLRVWSAASRVMFDLGILFLFASATLFLVPRGSLTSASAARLAPSGIMAVGFGIECIWLVIGVVTVITDRAEVNAIKRRLAAAGPGPAVSVSD